jgi:hypothetical protein
MSRFTSFAKRREIVALTFVLFGALLTAADATASSGAQNAHAVRVAHSAATGKKEALSYIKHFGVDMAKVNAYVLEEELALLAFTKKQTESKLISLSQAAQKAHDGINSIRNDFVLAGQITDNSQMGLAETNIWQGANGLKNAMGQMVAVTGAPNNAATAAKFETEFQQGQAEWNRGVKTVYRLAYGNTKDAPTV